VRAPAVVVLPSLLLLVACTSAGTEPLPGRPSHHVAGGFRNVDPQFNRPSAWTRWTFIARRTWESLTFPRAFEAPRVANDGAALREVPPPRSITWVGHATLLVQVDGLNVLTDPNWSARAGPTSWIGARRLNPPGLAFEDLPRIDVVTISHDHYDHLDLPTVKRLAAVHDPLFVVPLGMAAWFADNGMSRVVELDWWQEHEHRGVRFVCTPAQHSPSARCGTATVVSGPPGPCSDGSGASTTAATPATSPASGKSGGVSAPSTWRRCRSAPTCRPAS
jgi:hypothetical protein